MAHRACSAIDEQLGDDLIVVAESPRGRRARLLLQRPGEGARASLGDQRPLHPVEAEQALLAATVIPGRQVPLAPAVGEPPGVHQTGFTLVPEPQPSPLGDRREGGRHGFAARQGGQPGAPGDLAGRVLRTGGAGGAAQLAQGSATGVPVPIAVELYGGGSQPQGGELVLVQTGVGQLVLLAGDAVTDLVRMVWVKRFRGQGQAHLPQEVLVALEVAPEGVGVVGVALDALADLLAGERTGGVDQRRDQVDQALQPIHALGACEKAS